MYELSQHMVGRKKTYNHRSPTALALTAVVEYHAILERNNDKK